MSDDRKTYNVAAETAEKLESAAGRKGHESANDFLLRVSEMVGEPEDGMDVIEYEPPEDVLTVDHIEDLAMVVANQTADEIESRLR